MPLWSDRCNSCVLLEKGPVVINDRLSAPVPIEPVVGINYKINLLCPIFKSTVARCYSALIV